MYRIRVLGLLKVNEVEERSRPIYALQSFVFLVEKTVNHTQVAIYLCANQRFLSRGGFKHFFTLLKLLSGLGVFFPFHVQNTEMI